jgi:prolipoprotein diacylglyceryltransferase
MQFLIGVFCFFIFLYSLYVLAKDDYVLIRKNLSLEQLFDYAFIGVFTGIVLARILSIFFYPAIGKSFVSQLFSPVDAGFTLTGVVFGCALVLYLIGKYRKLPVRRLFDFFSLALLSSLPFGYLINIFFVKKNEIIYYLIPGILYLGIQIFFWKFLLSRIINNELKDGSLSSLFLLTFSLLSLFVSLFYKFKRSSLRFDIEDFLLMGIFLGSFVFLLRNEKRRMLRGKK